MSQPQLQWYDSTGTNPQGPLTFSDVVGGVATAAQTVRLYNAKDDAAAETATEVTVDVLERLPSELPYHQNGQVTRHRWLEMRAVGQGGTSSAQTTPWTPIGRGRRLRLDPIPKQSWRTLEVRVNAPGGAGVAAVEILLAADFLRPGFPLEQGHYESGGYGVLTGVGDTTFSYLLSGGDGTATGTPDDKVQFADLVSIHQGIPDVLLQHQVTFDGNDGNSVALAAGESYWATVSKGAGATLTVTKSAKGTSPLPISSRPAVPAGEQLVAYVEREFDATIEQADVYQDDRVFGQFGIAFSAASFSVTLGPGRALNDNELIRFDQESPLTVVASSTNRIWLQLGATWAVTQTATPPSDRATLLWEVVTDGSGVTSVVDRRRWIGPRPAELLFRWDAAPAGVPEYRYAVFPGGRDGYLRQHEPVVVALSDLGTGSTSGDFVFDLEYWSGAAWTTAYTSQGTQDRRPKVAWNATDLVDRDSLPEVLLVPAWSRWRLKLVSLPAGITVNPAAVSGRVVVEVP